MRRMNKVIAIFFSFTLILSGCISTESKDGTELPSSVNTGGLISENVNENISENIDVNGSDTLSYEEIYNRNYPSYEEVQGEYPNKTVIMWSFDGTMWDTIANTRTREVNAYLDAQGYDFVVCFDISSTGNSDEKYAYVNYIQEKIQNDEPVDIINYYGRYLIERRKESIASYNAIVYAGLMEPLDKYFKTEEGQNLYNLMPDTFWESLKIDGKIYGFNSLFDNFSFDFGYYVNSGLAEKYGFDTEKSIAEQLDILQAVKNGEKDIDTVVLMSASNIDTAKNFGSLNEIADGVYLENGEAHSVLDSDNYIENLRLVNLLATKLMLSYSYLEETHKDNAFIIMDNVKAGGSLYEGVDNVMIDYFGNKIETIPVFKTNTIITESASAVGICSASKNKEKAFELLTAIYTDPYLNNLLTYGVEGEDYTVEDGYIVLDSQHGNPVNQYRFSNKLIGFPTEGEPENLTEFYTKAYNDVDDEYLGFAFDGRLLEDEIIAVGTVVRSFRVNFMLADDFDETLELMREKLEDAGIQKIIDECNKQYQEWKAAQVT